MTVIGALSSFRELGEMSPHKRAQVHRFTLTGCRLYGQADRGVDRFPPYHILVREPTSFGIPDS
jgi:hypothetical protein